MVCSHGDHVVVLVLIIERGHNQVIFVAHPRSERETSDKHNSRSSMHYIPRISRHGIHYSLTRLLGFIFYTHLKQVLGSTYFLQGWVYLVPWHRYDCGIVSLITPCAHNVGSLIPAFVDVLLFLSPFSSSAFSLLQDPFN